jgi:hypothetical protein
MLGRCLRPLAAAEAVGEDHDERQDGNIEEDGLMEWLLAAYPCCGA